jgi:flavin reductase (DIM6/NTAB) family NADH-FMN oxidoreductase RutF
MNQEKVSVSVNEFRWFKLYLPIPMGCSIITTMDEQGRVNAAPFAMVFPWNNDEKEPQLIVMAFSGWHTSQNIKKTKEFVVNWPEVNLVKEIMKTAVLYDEGVNELNMAGLTAMPAARVKPPRIAECAGHYECKLNRIIEMGSGYHIIGDVVDISLNKDYAAMDRDERTSKIKLPIALGAPVGQWHYFFGVPGEIIKAEWEKM